MKGKYARDSMGAADAERFAMSCNIVALLNGFLKIETIQPMEPNGYLVRECIELAKYNTPGLSHFDHVIPLALPFFDSVYAQSIVKGIARSGNWQLLANMSAIDDSFLKKYRDAIVAGFAKEGLEQALNHFLAASDAKKEFGKVSVTTKGIFPPVSTDTQTVSLDTQTPGNVNVI